MLIRPTSALPPKKSKTGIVLGKTKNDHWLRARASVINPNTVAQVNWRHVMTTHRKQWASMAVGAQDGKPGFGATPASSWFACAATYQGILLPAMTIDGVAQTPLLRGISSPQAYYTMVQNNRIQLGLPLLPTPGQSPVMIAAGAAPAAITVNGFTIAPSALPPRTTGPLAAYVSVYASAQPTGPTPLTLTILSADTPLLPFLFSTWGNSSTGTPGPDVIYGDTLMVFIPSTAAPGTYNVTLQFTSGTDTATMTFPFVVSSPNTLPAEQAVIFTAPSSAYTSGQQVISDASMRTYYDDTYNLTTLAFAFETSDPNGQLAYTAAQIAAGQAGTGVQGPPCLFAVHASAIYTDSYEPPQASTWQPIGFSRPLLNAGEFNQCVYDYQTNNLISLWESVYGPLPATGYIKFSFTPIDPDTGGSGPTAIATAKWEAGTLKGEDASEWYGPQYGLGLIGQFTAPTSISGSNPYTLSYPTDFFGGYASAPVVFYVPTGAAAPIGPMASSMPDEQTLVITIPAGAPPPTTTDAWYSGETKGVITAPGSFNWLLSVDYVQEPGADTPPVFYPYTGTVSAKALGDAYIPTGTPSPTRALPPGVTWAFSPASATIDAATPAPQWILVTATAASGAMAFNDNVSIECTDNIKTRAISLLLQVSGDVTVPPPANFLDAMPNVQDYISLGASTCLYQFQAENSGPDDQYVTLAGYSADPDISFEFGEFASAAATATANSITFDLATGANVNALIGQTLSSIGYAPAGYNVTDAPILSNTAATITVLCANNPSAMTTQGSAGVVSLSLTVPAGTVASPGTANFGCILTIANPQTAPVTFSVITLNAGKNTTTCNITDGGISETEPTILFNPDGATINSPGTLAVAITVYNPSDAAIDMTLSATLSNMSLGITAVLTDTSLTVPASTSEVEGHIATTLTITVPSSVGTYNEEVTITGTWSGGTVFFIRSFGGS